MPQTFLLQIFVGINPPHNLSLYLGNAATLDPLPVNVGDEVGFLVQVLVPNGRLQPAYSVSFGEPTFFGTSTLDVPGGGTSPFLRVLSLQGKVKYTVTVAGLGKVLDPDIQSGGVGFPGTTGAAGTNAYVVTWDVLGQSVSYTNGGAPVRFSDPIVEPATVKFTVTNTGGAQPAGFTVTFDTNLDPPTHWVSPFEPTNPKFVPDDDPAVIGPLPVSNQVDGGSAFPFTATVTLNGHSYTLPNNPQPEITLP